jgi:hypothetical protein
MPAIPEPTTATSSWGVTKSIRFLLGGTYGSMAGYAVIYEGGTALDARSRIVDQPLLIRRFTVILSPSGQTISGATRP